MKKKGVNMTKLYGQSRRRYQRTRRHGRRPSVVVEASWLEVRVMKKVVAIEYVSNKNRINYSV